MPTKYTITIQGRVMGEFTTDYHLTDTEIIKLKDVFRAANRVLESDVEITSVDE